MVDNLRICIEFLVRVQLTLLLCKGLVDQSGQLNIA